MDVRVLLLAMGVLIGCSGAGERVGLATDDTLASEGFTVGCLGLPKIGVLIEDPTYGTALRQDGEGLGVEPVIWPAGFSGRRIDSGVEVLDPNGNVVATTGKRYQIYPTDGREGFVACGEVIPR